MKKIFLICLSLVVIISCKEQDDFDVNDYNGGEETYFVDLSINRDELFSVFKEPIIKVKVGSTVSTNADRTYGISIDASSTAVEGNEFSLSSSTVTIPAGDYVATYVIDVDFNSIPENGSTLILNLVETGAKVSSFSNQVVLRIARQCDSFLEGTHSVVGTNLQSGPGGSCPGGDGTNETTVTWEHQGDGAYTTSDASFGQFATCWGDSPAVGPGFVHNCNTITTDSGTDQYGDSYSYTIVSVSGSVMVIEWTNTYGDGGTATITREGGQDWQEELQTN